MIKKIAMLMFIGSLFLLQGCYDDYKEDYLYTTTYFARQFPLRTIVDEDGENLDFEVGTVLGGKYSNDTNEEVSFIIQDTLLNAYPSLTKLPDDYYTLESENIVIPSGEFKGSVNVTLDKDKFLNDPLAIGSNYALPLQIIGTSTDSILQDKHYSIIVVKYFNQYHGWYYTKGIDNTLDGSNNPIADEIFNYSFSDLVSNSDILFETSSKNVLKGTYSNVNSSDESGGSRGDFEITLDINPDNSVVVSGEDNGGITNINGTGTYDPNTRNFTIEYNYTDGDAAIHAVTEELIYRNTELVLEEWQ